MSKRRFPEFSYYSPAKPINVRGGIKAQSKKGKFGESWWAKRWISTLESFNIGARLQRGRSYARKGQVTSIEIEKGRVQAEVQGSRPRPYDIEIIVKVLTAADWKNVAVVFASQALFAAKLLAGEMPEGIEEAFKQCGLSLFPKKQADLKTKCSCPDWSNPCKHIAAVYYLLGEEFDRDPFLIFRLRGLNREELFELMGSLSASSVTMSVDILKVEEELLPSEGLSTVPNLFWGEMNLRCQWCDETAMSSAPMALLKRLGIFPFWRGESDIIESLSSVYGEASRRGIKILTGDRWQSYPCHPLKFHTNLNNP